MFLQTVALPPPPSFSRQSSMKPKDECCFLPDITLATHCYSSKIWLLSNIQQMLLLGWSPESTCKNKLMGKLLYAFLQQVVTMVEVKQHGNDFPKRGRCSLHYSRTEALLQQIHKKWGLWLLWSTHREEKQVSLELSSFPGLAHLSISCGESLGMRSQEHKGPDVTSSR